MPLEKWQTLAVKNAHPRDVNITFDEPTHIYTINGSSEGVISCTKFLHEFFPHFDADATIRKMMSGPNWKPGHKNWGMTAAQIKESWNANGREASGLGTAMHLAIEQFLNGADAVIRRDVMDTKEFTYFMNFWREKGTDLEPYRMEWEVYVEELLLAGQIDGVFRRKSDGKFVIYDWKRSKEIKAEGFRGEKGYAPLDHLDNCNYWQYTLQLNVYRWILKQYYDIEAVELYLVVLHPNNPNYVRIRCNILEDEVQDMFECRAKAVAQGRGQTIVLPIPGAHDGDEENDIALADKNSQRLMIQF